MCGELDIFTLEQQQKLLDLTETLSICFLFFLFSVYYSLTCVLLLVWSVPHSGPTLEDNWVECGSDSHLPTYHGGV